MITVRNVLVPGLILALTYLVPLHSQIQTTAPATTIATVGPAQTNKAPDEATKKITDLVHAGKYAEAQQLTAGLLIAYPDDQRLIKAKALIDNLLAPGGSTAAAPVGSLPTQSPSNANSEPLNGMDKVDYNALIALARQAKQTADLDEQTKLLKQFMDQSNEFLQKHPEQMLLWQLRAQVAMSMNDPAAGYEAGARILAAGGAESNDAALQQLLGRLKNKGWLNKQEAESQARSLEDARHAEEARQEHDKYTFPVAHANGLHYTFGHLTITPTDATYNSPDENIHFLKKDIHEMKVLCVGNSAFGGGGGCGFYFIPTEGRKFYFLAVTEDGVAKKTIANNVVLPPAVLGNAAVARWHFVQIDKKTLGPSLESSPQQTPAVVAQRAPEPAAPDQHDSTPFDDSNPQPPSQRTAAARASASLTPAPAPAPAVQADPSTINATSSQPSSSAGPTTAILHLYRLPHMGGAFAQYDCEIDGRRVAKLANAQSVSVDLPPGKHNINVTYRSVKSDRPLYDLEMESGKEYWVRVDLSEGFIVHMRLAVVPETEAREESGKLKEIAKGDLPGK